ncbi:hypothetical protein JMJ35_006855 [Cladonia borealis]|uniref:Choline transport protein n=1 Tax=Cladonia borealis TaxID=184061 RepID=A0AA39QWE6_9LECA|nr:hypothetical protein JMJ35_006855 [Cladonia borealis]
MDKNQSFELYQAPVMAQQDERGILTHHTRDEVDMARLGKKQVLKRNFGFMSMLGFSCTMMVTWEAILIVFLDGFKNGGPAGLVYGYLVVWFGATCVFITMAELSSMAPTSGGQYHWVSMLAPQSSRKFLSFLTGWLTATGWQASVASGGYLSGTLIQGMIVLNNPQYDPQRWQGTLLLWAVVFVAVFINTIISNLLPMLEGLILIIHVLGFFAIMIPLVYMSSHGSTSSVFTTFVDGGGWGNQGLSFWVGIIGNVFAFLGSDGTIHMAEEIQNASTIVPYSLLASITLNGFLGFGMLIAVLFCLGDLDAAENSPTGYPFMEIFMQATRSAAGSSVMITIVTILQICATIACLAGSSRMTWSFARDHGLPGWRILSRVDPRTSIPTASVAFTTTIACLLGLINIGSTNAFNDVISLTVGALYFSYLICSVLLLWRRCTGGIAPSYDALQQSQHSGEVRLAWGPWKIPGWAGIAVNICGIVYMTIILFFSFWPASKPATAANMNYSVLVLGSVVIFCVVYYVTMAHRMYQGPLIERHEL